MKDLNDYVDGNTLEPSDFNEIPSEIQQAITDSGQTLSSGDLGQLSKAIGGYSKTDKTAAALITPVAGKTMFVESSDGGLFKAVTGAAPATYSDNGGSYCGTQFIPTGGDGSAAWVRVDGGYNVGLGMDIRWFGAVVDGTTDDSTAAQLAYTAVTAGGDVLFPDGTTYIETGITVPTRADLAGERRIRTLGRGNAIIEQGTNNTYIFSYQAPATFFEINNVILQYTNQQASTATNAVAIRYVKKTAGGEQVGIGQFKLRDVRFEKINKGFGYDSSASSSDACPVWGYDIQGIYSVQNTGQVIQMMQDGESAGGVRGKISDVTIFGTVRDSNVAAMDLVQQIGGYLENIEFLSFNQANNGTLMRIVGPANYQANNIRIESYDSGASTDTNPMINVIGTGANCKINGLELHNCTIKAGSSGGLNFSMVRSEGANVHVDDIKLTGTTISSGTFDVLQPKNNGSRDGHIRYGGSYLSNTITETGKLQLHRESVDNGRVQPVEYEVLRWDESIAGTGALTATYVVPYDCYLVGGKVSLSAAVIAGQTVYPAIRDVSTSTIRGDNISIIQATTDAEKQWGAWFDPDATYDNFIAAGTEIELYVNTSADTGYPKTMKAQAVVAYLTGYKA